MVALDLPGALLSFTIQPKPLDGGTACCGSPQNAEFVATTPEVATPFMLAGIVELDSLARLRISSLRSIAFQQVAAPAGKREVLGSGRPPFERGIT